MDIHNLPEGTTPEDVAKAHAKDMETQRKYGVEYTKYWLNEKAGKVFCLCHAPNAEAAKQVHREAHGLLPDKIIEIQPELAEGFVGGVETNAAGAVILPGGGASPAGAVRCAIQIQRELDKHAQANPDRQLKVRVGAAAGEPVEQHNDLFGTTVQLAARLCAHAQPEQILVSNAIAELCLGKGLLFEDLGEVSLKGFGSPVRAHAAAWREVVV